jgi:hypothetical protein
MIREVKFKSWKMGIVSKAKWVVSLKLSTRHSRPRLRGGRLQRESRLAKKYIISLSGFRLKAGMTVLENCYKASETGNLHIYDKQFIP